MAIGLVSYNGQSGSVFDPYAVDRASTYSFFYDPAVGDDGNATDTSATTGAAAILTDLSQGNGAVLALDAGAATAAQGEQLQWKMFGLTPDATKPIYFRAKLVFKTTVVNEFFIGLAEVDTTVIASSASGAKMVGFGQLGDDDGNIDAVAADASDGTSITKSLALDAAVDTEYDFQFIATTGKVRYWVNGVEAPAITTTIPTDAMCPTIVCQGAGSGRPVVHLTELQAYRAK